ncbi:hypothetical protein AVEN_128613-1 [Araneus ventricosus]|uniref:Uncharacterized protein n=1 Tax=Araneus ventricosus TaxID=182803 RepID=A0A4Y2NQ43_ARAVE|nr:hypothetical protein AVEN_128613-1 [Araneus ventricosus]
MGGNSEEGQGPLRTAMPVKKQIFHLHAVRFRKPWLPLLNDFNPQRHSTNPDELAKVPPILCKNDGRRPKAKSSETLKSLLASTKECLKCAGNEHSENNFVKFPYFNVILIDNQFHGLRTQQL